VLAIGGDGTIREIINGIMKREESPTLAVLQAGKK
jgi:diacylglycerol kinase family enzyme